MAYPATSEGFPAIAASAALQSALAGLDVSLDEELERYSTWRACGRMTAEAVYRPPMRPAARTETTVDLPLRLANPNPTTPTADSVAPPITQPITKPITAPTAAAPETTATLPDDPTEPMETPMASTTAAAAEVEEGRIGSEENPLVGLWTPAGLASFGLLAVASFTLGWFLLDPAGLGRFLQPSAPPPNEGQLPQSLSEPVDPTVAVPLTQDPLPTGFVPLPGLGDRPGQSQAAFTRPAGTPTVSVGPAPTPPTATAPVAAPTVRLRELDLPPPPTHLPPIEPARSPVEPVAPVFPVVTRPRPLPEPVVTRPRRAIAPEPAPRPLPPPPESLAPQPVVQALPPTPPPKSVPAAPVALPPAPRWAPPVEPVATPAPAHPVRYAEPVAPAPPSNPAPSYAAPSYTIVAPPTFAAQARQVEQDAFVRPQDGQVQLGAYRDPLAAQQRIAELRSQGIPAELR